ncbi:hypothetical protein GGI13_003666, partial [Coemansia sp. RSA 455]
TITGSQHKSTPGCEFLPNEANKSKLELDDRRELLASILEGLGTSLPFPELLGELGLESVFKVYESATGAVFDSAAGKLLSSVLNHTCVIGDKLGKPTAEKDYVKRLMEVVRSINH